MPPHAEDRLREKLRKIEALYAGAATAGEKSAASRQERAESSSFLAFPHSVAQVRS